MAKQFYLANGKRLTKENIDIRSLINLNNVQRAFSFAGVPPSVNMTVAGHSYLTYLTAGIFCKLYKDQPSLKRALHTVGVIEPEQIACYAMGHDMAEALLGDVPTPLKHPDFAKFEDEVLGDIFCYIGFDIHKYNAVESIVKFCDIVASLYECLEATKQGYDLMSIARVRYESVLQTFGDSDLDRDLEAEVVDGHVKIHMSHDSINSFIEKILGLDWKIEITRSIGP